MSYLDDYLLAAAEIGDTPACLRLLERGANMIAANAARSVLQDIIAIKP